MLIFVETKIYNLSPVILNINNKEDNYLDKNNNISLTPTYYNIIYPQTITNKHI